MCIMHGGGQGNKPLLLQSQKWHVLLHKSHLLTKMILLFYVYMYVPHWPMMIACKNTNMHIGITIVVYYSIIFCMKSPWYVREVTCNMWTKKRSNFKSSNFMNMVVYYDHQNAKGINVLHNIPFRERFAFYDMQQTCCI